MPTVHLIRVLIRATIHATVSVTRSRTLSWTTTDDGAFHDTLRHTADQEQTTTYCSSVDPWHRPSDRGSTRQAQVGFDIFYTSGVTRGLPR